MSGSPISPLLRQVALNSLGDNEFYPVSQKVVTEELNKLVPKTRTVNGKPLTGNITLSSDDVGSYSKEETDNALKLRVPTSRRINNKPLSEDLELSSQDVGAYSTTQVDDLLKDKADISSLPAVVNLLTSRTLVAGKVNVITQLGNYILPAKAEGLWVDFVVPEYVDLNGNEIQIKDPSNAPVFFQKESSDKFLIRDKGQGVVWRALVVKDKGYCVF